MPKPRKNENQDAFIARCIPELVREGRQQGQAIAICYSTWNEHSGKKGMHGDVFHEEDDEDDDNKPRK